MDKCCITSLISDMEHYAKINRIPIMQLDAIDYICDYIKDNNFKSVLEIGTAIGYSAIKMCHAGVNKLTTIERDEKRYNLAIENISKAGMENNINVIILNTNLLTCFIMGNII